MNNISIVVTITSISIVRPARLRVCAGARPAQVRARLRRQPVSKSLERKMAVCLKQVVMCSFQVKI